MFRGSMVALVTPMHEDGTVDDEALAALIEWHIAERHRCDRGGRHHR